MWCQAQHITVFIPEAIIHGCLENSPKKICALIGWKSCFYNSKHRTSRSYWLSTCKENLHFDDESKQAVSPSFFSVFSIEGIENMSSVFLLSYRNTRESLREWEMLWKHSSMAHVHTAFLVLLNFKWRYSFTYSNQHWLVSQMLRDFKLIFLTGNKYM